jgi:hypothetical protein
VPLQLVPGDSVQSDSLEATLWLDGYGRRRGARWCAPSTRDGVPLGCTSEADESGRSRRTYERSHRSGGSVRGFYHRRTTTAKRASGWLRI